MPTLASRDPTPLNLDRNAVLLCIDVQKGFDQIPGRNNPGFEATLARLQDGWRAAGRPVWHVRHDSVEPKSVLRPNQPGHGFKPETAPKKGEPVIPKSVHSAFIGTDLEDRLQAAGCETLVIAGIQTNFCVATTARMAGNLGYQTFVVGDACATFPQELLGGKRIDADLAHDVALGELHGEFATVVQAADVLAALK